MDLETIKASDEELIRAFKFPEGGGDNAFTVQLQYLSPQRINELTKQIAARDNNPARDEKLSPAERNREATTEVLLSVILGCQGVTVRKLQPLYPMSAAKVRSAGGFNAEVPLGGRDPKAQKNLAAVLRSSDAFHQFCLSTATDLSKFQDAKWEAEVLGNSEAGRDTSSA